MLHSRPARAGVLVSLLTAAALSPLCPPVAAESDPAQVQRDFWGLIHAMEGRAGDGDRGGRQEIVGHIGADLGGIPERYQIAAMGRFLAIAAHYRAMTDPASSPEARAAHERAFLDGVRDFRDRAEWASNQGGNPAFLNLYADIRALATTGPDGLRISEALARLDPSNPVVQRNLAQDLVNNGRPAEASQAARQAIALAPSDPQAYTALASARYAEGDFPGAREAAASALRLDPENAVAFSLLKLSEAHVGPAGREDVAGAARPGRAASTAAAGPAPPGAPPALSAADASETAAARRLLDLSALALREGNPRRASELAARALARSPGDPNALSLRAQAFAQLGRPADALTDAQAALARTRPDGPALMGLKISLLNALRRHSEALEAADQSLVLELDAPTRAQTLYQRAWALAGLGRRREAAGALGEAARLDPRYAPVLDGFLTLPADVDASLFFSSESAGGFPTARASGRRPRREPGPLTIIGSSLVGGCLVAFGLLSVRGRRWRDSLRSALRVTSLQREVAAVSPPEPDAGAEQAAAALLGPGAEPIAGVYEVRRKLGTGGMGEIYEAFDRNLERRVAIKKLREEQGADPEARARILQEARTVAALRHPNIVEIYSVVERGGDLFLVFEHVDGHTLLEYLRRHKRLPYDWALSALEGISGALDYAHGRDVIHRDLKPSNVMIDRDGIVKVMDFGIAHRGRDSVGRRVTGSGTPSYMAPEAERGSPRKESDVFSMGVTLYEMVTGRLPFSGTPAGMSLSKMNASYFPPSQLNPNLPANFDRVLSWALAPDPSKRWRSPGQFVRNLQNLGPAPAPGRAESAA